jgi:hypothetical protein
MRTLSYKNSIDAFNGINETLIFDEGFVKKSGIYSKSQTIAYDTLIKVHKSMFPEDWDFTKMVNYRKTKWKGLVTNYVDNHHLQEVVSEVQSRELRKANSYTISFWFSNNHGGGKGCLLACTFTKRPGDFAPILYVTVRASEVYKRLAMDLLLLHRIGEECYGEGADFGIRIWIPHCWEGVSWGAMWLSQQPKEKIKELEKSYGPSPFYTAVKERLAYLRDSDYEKFSYNADKRAAKVIQGDVATPPLLAKDCHLTF